MNFMTTVALAAALCPIHLAAQTFKASANPVSDAVRDFAARGSKNLVASAELMPAEKYGYHPTPSEEVTMFGRRTSLTRAATMLTIATDWADHYSTAASYLRQNGILPPTAQPKK